MQPSGKCGLSAKARDLAIELEKGFLGKILSGLDTAYHAETEGVDTPFVKIVKDFEALGIALLGTFDGFGF
jgi:hypothetical protein